MRSWGCLLLLLCGLLAACRREPPSDAGPVAARSIERQQAELDAGVWAPERLAQQCEQTFVHLADDLRATTNKAAVLAALKFETLAVERPAGEPAELPLGIRLQRFATAEAVALTPEQWRAAVRQFDKAGWQLAHFEYRHEKFSPSSNSAPARSEIHFEVHGSEPARSNRFILTGMLAVEWNTASTPSIRGLRIHNLSLLERSGAPGFSDHLLLAPEPLDPQGQINLHPLIISDINGDGYDDIVLPGINRVLLNDGRANFHTNALFADLNFNGVQPAGVVADFNGDGKPDFLGVAELGPMAKMLVLYPGAGALPLGAPVAAWPLQRSQFERYKIVAASAITVGDIDGDGDLDVFVAQYRPPYTGGQLPTPYYDANDGYASYLLLNDGRGQFELASESALRAKSHRRTLSASFVDLDGDGDLDLVTLNDYSGIDLFLNDGKGHFSDDTARMDNRSMFGMGLAFGDFDRDGALDLFATGMSIPTVHRLESMGLAPSGFADRTGHRAAMGYGNRLFVRRDGRWMQPAWARPLAETGWSWGTCAFDFDNSGWPDFYVANGHVSGASITDYDTQCWTHDVYLGSSERDPELDRYLSARLGPLNEGRTSWAGYLHNVLFMDLGSNQYLNIAYLMGVAHETDCRAVVSADFNEDGRPDLVLTEAQWQGTPNIMRHRLLVHLNELPATNHWIGARLSGGHGASVIGAKVRVLTATGPRIAHIIAGDSFQSQEPQTIHFGLGREGAVQRLEIIWPDGKTTSKANPKVDQYHLFDRE